MNSILWYAISRAIADNSPSIRTFESSRRIYLDGKVLDDEVLDGEVLPSTSRLQR
jgi:hypothetical protein